MSDAMDQHRNNIHIETLRKVKCAFVETQDGAILRTGALREDQDGIAPVDRRLQLLLVLLQPVRDRQELRISNDPPVERAVPNPLVRQADNLRT